MNVKIDTKEKFHEISVLEQQLTANMTAECSKMLSLLPKETVKNVILILSDVSEMDLPFAEWLANAQASSYEDNCSFVICGLQPSVETMLDAAEILEVLNVTPTLSEAWDIVQMEEIERELLGDF